MVAHADDPGADDLWWPDRVCPKLRYRTVHLYTVLVPTDMTQKPCSVSNENIENALPPVVSEIAPESCPDTLPFPLMLMAAPFELAAMEIAIRWPC